LETIVLNSIAMVPLVKMVEFVLPLTLVIVMELDFKDQLAMTPLLLEQFEFMRPLLDLLLVSVLFWS